MACGPNVSHVNDGELAVVECIQSCGACPECRRDNWIACQGRTELGVIGRNGGYSEYVTVPGRFVHRLAPDYDLKKACADLCSFLRDLKDKIGIKSERIGAYSITLNNSGVATIGGITIPPETLSILINYRIINI